MVSDGALENGLISGKRTMGTYAASRKESRTWRDDTVTQACSEIGGRQFRNY